MTENPYEAPQYIRETKAWRPNWPWVALLVLMLALGAFVAVLGISKRNWNEFLSGVFLICLMGLGLRSALSRPGV